MTIVDSTPEKIIYTRQELSEAPLVLAIYYEQKGEQGVFFASKCDRDTQPWFEICHPSGTMGVGILSDDKPEDEPVAVGMIAGVGNQFELEYLVNRYRSLLFSEISSIGMYKNISREVRLAFANVANDQFRSFSSTVPCRVEMLIVTRFFGELEIFRVKGDGDFHKLSHFGVIGGYKKIRGRRITVRAMALKLLDTFYKANKRPPTMKEASNIADLALAEDKRKLPHEFISAFSFKEK